jgi:hypothetical protein
MQKPERTVKPKAAAKRKEMPRPKTTAPKAVDRVVFQLVDGVASMRLKLTYVMKGGRKIPTVNAVALFSTLEEAEEFRRRLRLSGINASVVSRGKDGFEVTVPKDELEKLTPEEKEAVKRYLEHIAQTRDEEKRKAAEEILRRFDFSAKAVNIGGVRLKLVRYERKSKGVRAEKYGNPQLIAEIKTALENKLKETLGDEYEKMEKPHKNKRERKTPNNNATIARKTRAKPQHHQTKRKNLKTHKN